MSFPTRTRSLAEQARAHLQQVNVQLDQAINDDGATSKTEPHVLSAKTAIEMSAKEITAWLDAVQEAFNRGASAEELRPLKETQPRGLWSE